MPRERSLDEKSRTVLLEPIVNQIYIFLMSARKFRKGAISAVKMFCGLLRESSSLRRLTTGMDVDAHSLFYSSMYLPRLGELGLLGLLPEQDDPPLQAYSLEARRSISKAVLEAVAEGEKPSEEGEHLHRLLNGSEHLDFALGYNLFFISSNSLAPLAPLWVSLWVRRLTSKSWMYSRSTGAGC